MEDLARAQVGGRRRPGGLRVSLREDGRLEIEQPRGIPT